MRLNRFYYFLIVVAFLSCEVARKEECQTSATKTNLASVVKKEDATIGLKIGQQAPDISLPDPNGQIKTLSTLRGSYVLVDFWASWCGPCRFENPNVVRLFQQYKEKGFEVYSVSLDSDKQKWINAIETDGMEWNHVSDLQKWESSVVPLYNIDGIPMTFLLDKEGIIIAKNLRGTELNKKIETIFAH